MRNKLAIILILFLISVPALATVVQGSYGYIKLQGTSSQAACDKKEGDFVRLDNEDGCSIEVRFIACDIIPAGTGHCVCFSQVLTVYPGCGEDDDIGMNGDTWGIY